ncbi:MULTISPECIES: sn-glycerol-3-phosphate ABC transporter ATP-binding protein UgpC [Rhizobium]|uniref:sn-glycerol-3-phosphate ABC transporter ATP-binding protein UgpC n=1 Tax=Rhizobium changzhiense TaxID=2692317 RepID=A0A7Z0RNP4_9HYPH|nr:MULTISPECIES: sn-glycerol-3-phosphate ABC transporter ATP-binding protein UgpC [Rhizobium]KAF5881571.1 sn-glycerol-3-phosphate ABC transporter ATP-binding protein UgpC [Rhizobium sp. PEPV16]MBY3329935.1 sn-glycerol-3-phosphate ABC transporter ATP-binding protein UgpC [Rhizobium laguerreae]MBY5508262.1 sn-glycerol-3-phosphate ABC transporter ATP-binding protein UgpC [Rhizobium leguminosarum]MCH4549334.1 sn-glycerol-3-phosphate ABC transporter ATP-binding protein UgpC [Rhizobium changzhiense]
MASMTFDGIGKTFPDGTVAVANVSFSVADGEFVVLVGPSGCGKSTLLRMAAGLEALNSGRLLMDDADVTETEPQDRDIAMVFQNYALYPHMTVYDNMAFGLQQRKMPKDKIDKLVRDAAEMLDLARYLERKPGALSGGQRQRVAMGRAIVRHPMAFLMDEPLSNLDAKLRVQMRGELKLLNQRLGVTTLYVTHDQVEAMTMGDRVAVLKPVFNGQESNLQQIDTPQKLYDKPSNLFVAGFIGSPAMNFVRIELTAEAGTLKAAITGTNISFSIPAQPALSVFAGRQVIVGIRPEMFKVCPEAEALFNEQIPVAEALGADTFVFFDIASPPVNINDAEDTEDFPNKGKNRLVARIPPALTPRPNQVLPLTVDLEKLHWFDPVTGAAIRD